MRKRTKGFTLIELLAVIVILANIALIAVPVILNIIDKANKSAFKDSVYGVLNAAEYYYAASQLELEGPMSTVDMPTTDSRLELKGSVPNGHVWITRDGEIALIVQNDRYCVTKGYGDDDITITEDVENCKAPIEENTDVNQGTSGAKTLTELAVDNFSVTNVDGTNPTVVTKPACLTDGTTCKAGTPVAIKVNENETYRFYVLKEENNKVTLIMDRNLGDNVAWYAGESSDNSHGPVTALNELKERTKNG